MRYVTAAHKKRLTPSYSTKWSAAASSPPLKCGHGTRARRAGGGERLIFGILSEEDATIVISVIR